MKKVFLFMLLASLFTSCLEYKEKMKLDNSGSGEITFSVGLSESLFKMNHESKDMDEFDESKLKEKYSKCAGIKFLGSRTYSESGNRWIEINLSFESLKALELASRDSSNKGMIGEISLKENADGNIVYERILSQNSDTTKDELGNSFMQSMFGGYKWTYELTVPGKIVFTNAEQANVDYSQSKIKWIIPMVSLNQSAVMKVIYTKPSSVSLPMVFLLAISAIILATVLLQLLKRKKDE